MKGKFGIVLLVGPFESQTHNCQKIDRKRLRSAAEMEENEFRGFLEVFPVIRSRNYHVDGLELLQDSNSSAQNEVGDPDVLQNSTSFAQNEVDSVNSEKFCKTFQLAYEKMVCEMLSPDALRNFVSSKRSPQ
ncbi:hypothetical protein ZOSMA_18G01170 [Zostera marina]|uniref:Uncharacterized protein n=1 Tax=Zostera marina TaxID=29655 RepID=A0A0K9PPX6_ZOSMR|nr:hypothetical protein ZOSMA_18G01170 [Zostera marina]